jgi:hypothetical protein
MNRILPIWAPLSEKQGVKVPKMSKNPLKTAKKLKN